MSHISFGRSKTGVSIICAALFAAVFAFVAFMTGCSGTSTPPPGMATVITSMSDPPTCSAPAGDFDSVFVTIRSVQANISSTAGPSSSGWQELVPQVVSQPVQLDLLHLPKNGQCLLAQLGSTTSLPTGDYQQIRVMLLSNQAPTGPAPVTNACASLGQVFNCVVKNGVAYTLDLNSQDITGLKIPPGQIVGGPIHVVAGQSTDINIDFDACRSIVAMGPNGYRLKPTLTAGQVSSNLTGISGQIVDKTTSQPIAGAMVALELPDGNGTDRIFMQALTDANGNFSFCPLPVGATFDVVADAVVAGTAYNATVVLNVPGGTNTGAIPLIAETGTKTGPGTIQGSVTSLNGATGANLDVAAGAFQNVSLSGGGTRPVTIPALPGSASLFNVQSSNPCPDGRPTGAYCGSYSLILPASNPNVGNFSAGSITYTAPASGDVLYTVEARATSGGSPICSPSSLTTSKDITNQPLKVTASSTTTASRMDFSGCS